MTATRLHQLPRAEGYAVGVTVVKGAVAEWKRQQREPLIPLTYRPGELAQVDFFEVVVDVAGVRRKALLFLLRLMYSGRDFGWIYERQDQISVLDGHVRAFAHLGGVPARTAYDNLKPAVAKISPAASVRSPCALRRSRRTTCLSPASVVPAWATTRAGSKAGARPCACRR